MPVVRSLLGNSAAGDWKRQPFLHSGFSELETARWTLGENGRACVLGMNLNGAGAQPERVAGGEVPDDRLLTLGVEPALGRVFPAGRRGGIRQLCCAERGPMEDRYGADRGIVGKAIELDGKPYTVIGVMPSGFDGLEGKSYCGPHCSFNRAVGSAVSYISLPGAVRLLDSQLTRRGASWMPSPLVFIDRTRAATRALASTSRRLLRHSQVMCVQHYSC